MRVGNFSVLILPGRERDSGHVVVPHGSVYSIRLGNHFYGRRCDAEVTIDGKHAGTFRLESGATMTLERPAHDEGRFTFYRNCSNEAKLAGVIKVANNDRGLVQVVFKPEHEVKRWPVPESRYTPAGWATTDCDGPEEKTSGGILRSRGLVSNCSAPLSTGITGLSGHSNQQFHTVADLVYDHSQDTTITVRLVAGDEGPRELTPAPARRSNPVPEPVGGGLCSW